MKRSYSPKEILSILLPALFSILEAGLFSYCNGHLLPLSLRSLAVLPCAALLYYCTRQLIKTCRSYNKAEWITSIVLALLLSVIIIYCNAVYYNDWLFFEPVHCYKSLLIFPGILVIFLTLMHLELKDIPYPKATEFASIKRFPIAVYGSVFLSFLICLISHFPGHFGYDAVFQYEQYINHAITTHHPLLHTLLLCGLVRFGETVFSSAAAGLLIYTAVQMGVLTYALGKGVLFVQKRAGNWAYIVWALVLFLPYHAILSISATKDVLFGAFFLLYAICLYEGIETREVWQSRAYCLRFILLTFLVCAFRNNGIYVVIATLPFLFLILKNQLREVLVSSGIALVLYVLLTGPVSSMIGVTKGPIHEMLSVPIQQLAVTYSQPWDANLTQEEKDLIYRYMPNVDYVTKRSADIVKNDFNDALFLEDPMRFFRLYLSVGSRNIQLYLNAYTNLHMGFYNPEMVWPNPQSFHPFLEWTLPKDDPRLDSSKYLQIPTQTLSWRLSAHYERYANENTFMKYPLLQHLSSIGVYTWAMLLGLLISLFRKKWGCVLVLLMSFFYFGTCILGPVVLFRYAYAYILTVTVFLPLIFHNTDKAR
ncbi:MAG: hypothetical protein IKE59_08560 [Erysipelotrichaceae bacterium]|nr:hypothetical protein [Erysipelotrichaceae bacterium]